jgi:methylenetetrahydrofolate reductase (NADPH)
MEGIRSTLLVIDIMTASLPFPTDKLGLSFELFPPKTAAAEQSLWENVAELVKFKPDFFTCTYGAGGSTRDKTLDICQTVKDRFGMKIASHLTCVGSTVDQLRQYLTEATQRGVDYIVALRGDPPKGETEFKPVPGGFRYANELVAFLRDEFPRLGRIVAGYPEKHLEAPSLEVDLENLKRKVEAGGDVVVTQLFYDNADFFRFRERYDAAGIRAPLVPGILPVTNLAQIQRIASLCGAKLPPKFIESLSARGDDSEWQFKAGVAFATEQVQELLAHNIPGLHFYVLNKSSATASVLQSLSMPGR